jgi:hypothetical protein
MTIEEYAMENGISLEEAQKQLEAAGEREPPKKRPRKVVDE